jgi:glycosyltransferase involved in cell wall biosynthesis/SAM-dependent methyltransferase
VLKNTHFEYFYTTHFGLDRAFYEGKKVLDVGCGPRGSLEWADMAAQRVGLDPLAHAYREVGTAQHRMIYVAAGAEAIPFPDGHFDLVTSFNSLDHVDDLDRAIGEITRVLARGGLFLLLTDIRDRPTIREPQVFSADVLDRFAPGLKLLDVKQYDRLAAGMYASVRAGLPRVLVPPEGTAGKGVLGCLSAKLRRAHSPSVPGSATHLGADRRKRSSETPSGQALIVAGMHRSGTSVVAQALGWAGLWLGDRLKAPTRHNREGYFEDEDLIRFHDELLTVNGAAWDLADSLSDLCVPSEYAHKARALLMRKFHGRALWGWKDPRTTLFLDFWDALLPTALWVLVLRRPEEVVASLMRRGDMWHHTRNPARRARMALRLWMDYNRKLLEFAHKNPARVFALLAPDDFARSVQESIAQHMSRQWQVALKPLDLHKVYVAGLLKTEVPAWVSALVNADRRASDLMQQLNRLRQARQVGLTPPAQRDVRPAIAAPDAQARVLCVITPREFAYSETFIRDHIRQLPGRVHALYGGSRRGGTTTLAEASGLALLEMLVTRSQFPNRLADGRGLVSIPGRGIDLVLKHVFKLSRQPCSERALRSFMRRERVEVVLAEFGQTGAQVTKACESAAVPLVVHFHGSDIYKQKWIDLYLPAYREMFATAAAIIAVSRDMVERLAGLGAPRDRLFYNPCGVDVEWFDGADPAAALPTFLAVGRFVEKKAPHLTLMAFKRVFDQHPEAHLVFIGDGALSEVCRQMTCALGMEGAVSYPGVRSRLEVAMAMRTARAFVQHSVQTGAGDAEGTPVSVLEAAATGLPVVSTRHGGIKDVVVDGKTGFLVEEGDIEGMAQHMIELVQSPGLAAALGRKARHHVHSEFSMDKRIAQLSRILDWAVEQYGSRSK